MYRSKISIAVLAAVFAASAVALVLASPVLARGFGGGGFRGGGGGFGGGDGFARPSPSFGPDNRPWHTGDNNINTGDIDVNSNNGGWGWGWGSGAGLALGAAAATGAVTFDDYAAAPTVIYDLPPSCSPVLIDGTTYQNCDGTYYEPVYNGSSVVYQAAPAQY